MSPAARIAIAVVSFLVVFAILVAFGMYRRRKIARANMAFVTNNPQQGYPNQYPPPPQGGYFGGSGQKEQQAYDSQQYNGQYNPQYSGQYSPQYNAPQYPPAAYDQGNSNQPVSSVPVLGLSSFSPLSCRRLRTLATGPRLVLPLNTKAAPTTRRELVRCNALYHYRPCSSTAYAPEFTTIAMT